MGGGPFADVIAADGYRVDVSPPNCALRRAAGGAALAPAARRGDPTSSTRGTGCRRWRPCRSAACWASPSSTPQSGTASSGARGSLQRKTQPGRCRQSSSRTARPGCRRGVSGRERAASCTTPSIPNACVHSSRASGKERPDGGPHTVVMTGRMVAAQGLFVADHRGPAARPRATRRLAFPAARRRAREAASRRRGGRARRDVAS